VIALGAPNNIDKGFYTDKLHKIAALILCYPLTEQLSQIQNEARFGQQGYVRETTVETIVTVVMHYQEAIGA
jgi:hypothetical protein